MSLRIEFVERAEKGEKVAALCREFGLSRTTGHKWLKRFKELGHDGLEEESRRPKSTPMATAEDLVIAVLEARDARPRLGPRKLGRIAPTGWFRSLRRTVRKSPVSTKRSRNLASSSRTIR